jgi:FHA domain
MRPAWSSFLALVAAAAALDAHIAAAGTTESLPDSRYAIAFSAQDFLPGASVLDEMADRGAQVLAPARQWIGESYARAPALVLGLSVVMVVPPLALVGLLARRKRRTSAAPSPDTTLALTRAGKHSALETNALKTEGFSWPTEAWVDIQGAPGGRYVIGRTLVRIGREADNDIRLSAKTVHRYHAVIRRTTDGDVMVTDLSGNEGNGVLVNGKPIDEARLKKGDIINVGEVKLHFDAKPI